MSMVDEARSNRAVAYLLALRRAKHAMGESIPCKIEEGLYLGSVEAARNRDELKSLNITHVLVVARSLTPAFPDDFVYKKIDVLDSLDTNLREHFDECFDFIDEARRAGGGVLVHCFAGISRSATIIVAYLMKKHKMTLSQALILVKSKRPQIVPNQGFMIQLENFEKSLGGASSQEYIIDLEGSCDSDDMTAGTKLFPDLDRGQPSEVPIGALTYIPPEGEMTRGKGKEKMKVDSYTDIDSLKKQNSPQSVSMSLGKLTEALAESNKTRTMEKESFGCEACINVVFSLPIEKGSSFFYKCLNILSKSKDYMRMFMALKDLVLQLGYLQILTDDVA